MEVFSDASLGNVEEGKLQIGYVIGLVDGVSGEEEQIEKVRTFRLDRGGREMQFWGEKNY